MNMNMTENELEFQARLLDTIGQSVIATDLEGTVTFWNRAAEKIYGWSREEAIGENILSLTPSNQSQGEAEDIMKSLQNGIAWSGEFTVKRKDGTTFPAQVTDSPILDSEGELVGIIGISTDITERKKLEERLEKTYSLARIGSYEIDCGTKEVYWSSMTKKIHEVDESYNPTFENAISFYAEEDQLKIFEIYQKAVQENEKFDVEAKITTDAGNLRWVRLIGEPELKEGRCVKLRGSFQDIDKVKKSEFEVLKASEEKEKILESIGDAFFALDHEWIVTYWNSEAEKILQCPKDKIIGQKLVNFFDIRNTSFAYHYEKAATEKATQHFEAFFDGTKSWYEVSAYPSSNGLSIFFKDITEQKETTFKLKELNRSLQTYTDELVLANKGLEQFSYIISHNLRAPVANILGLADLLEDGNSETTNKKILDGLVGNVKRLDNVMRDLNQILQVKNKFSEKKESVNLQDIVYSIEKSLQNLIEKEQVEINTDFSACHQVTTVPGYLYSIFYNLIFNSIKYRKEGVKPVIEIKSILSEDKVYFKFRDNGIGIDLRRNRDKIFRLYKRFHNHVEGKGLGLFMVKTQVEMLGGKITVSSQPDKGTTFTIEWNQKILTEKGQNEAIYSS